MLPHHASAVCMQAWERVDLYSNEGLLVSSVIQAKLKDNLLMPILPIQQMGLTQGGTVRFRTAVDEKTMSDVLNTLRFEVGMQQCADFASLHRHQFCAAFEVR